MQYIYFIHYSYRNSDGEVFEGNTETKHQEAPIETMQQIRAIEDELTVRRCFPDTLLIRNYQLLRTVE